VQREDRRFVDPLICEIAELWRQRQAFVNAQCGMTRQIRAVLLRLCDGDKAEAAKLYASLGNGRLHPLANLAWSATFPLYEARGPLEAQRKVLEKRLEKLGKQLPIAHLADEIKGVNHLTLAKIAAECGDLSAYKSVAAVWKRCGQAVIDGERQRRCANAEKAIRHGFSPMRAAVMWNIGEALFKSQGSAEKGTAGPYRLIYDRERAKQEALGQPKGVAHPRGKRVMLKAFLKHAVLAWRKAARKAAKEQMQ